MRRIRVLIVDDHETVREALADLLDLLGFEVVGGAGDGVDGVAMAKDLEPDLVLMDLSMPVLNGWTRPGCCARTCRARRWWCSAPSTARS
jgi:DNA-binding NarL/FixJ family response regulator